MDRENFDPWSFYPNAFMDGEYDSRPTTGIGQTRSSDTLLLDLTSESVECAKRVHEVLGKSKQIHEEAKRAMSLARKAFIKAEIVSTIAKDTAARCSTLVEAVMMNQKLLTEDQVYWSSSPEAKEGLQIEEFQQVLDFGSLTRQGVSLSPNSFDTDISLQNIITGMRRWNARNVDVGCQSACDVEDSVCQTDDEIILGESLGTQDLQPFSDDSYGCTGMSVPSVEDGTTTTAKQQTSRSCSGEEIWRRRENVPQTVQQSSEDFIERLSCSLPTVNEDKRTDTNKDGSSDLGIDVARNSRRKQPVDEKNSASLSIFNTSPKKDNSQHVGNNAKLSNGAPLATIQQQRLQTPELIEEQSQSRAQFQQTYNGASSPEIRSRPGSPLVTDEENRRITMQLQPSSSPQLFHPKKTRSSSSTDM